MKYDGIYLYEHFLHGINNIMALACKKKKKIEEDFNLFVDEMRDDGE